MFEIVTNRIDAAAVTAAVADPATGATCTFLGTTPMRCTIATHAIGQRSFASSPILRISATAISG